jgi:hypothetical protein
MSRIARIGSEHRPAKQTVVLLWAAHDSPSLRRIMRRNGAPPSALPADQEGENTKKDEPKMQGRRNRKTLAIKTVEENRRRKSTTFKPPDSNDFQNAADSASTNPPSTRTFAAIASGPHVLFLSSAKIGWQALHRSDEVGDGV